MTRFRSVGAATRSSENDLAAATANLPFAATQAATARTAAAAATAARTRSRPSWRSGSATYAHSEAPCTRGT